ncbi:MAG TPA: ATP-binding cassette domain-containing protein [Nocardioidaceae bacterium]|nr:ATP-binding cassette domain-containing protein [Nocardioidaceae bacterium]
METTMIQTEGLTKHFTAGSSTVEAVRGIDLTVRPGEMVALLGPNGAGKSTTLRMLTTLLPPTAGVARVAGYDVTAHQAQVRRRIGYIGQGNGAGHSQRGRDELVAQGRAYGMPKAAARSRADELVGSLDLTEVADRKVMSLSGGQRRRLDIAMGLIHEPDLLFLDEPSTGLDPQNRANLQAHIVALRNRHETTVVLTTHYLDEADALAERVVVVDHGRVVADDTPARLKATLAGDRVTLAFATPVEAARASGRARAVAESVAQDGRTLELRVRDGDRLLPALLRDLDAHGTAVVSAELTRPTLDDVFLNLTGRSLREGRAAHDVRTTDTDLATEEACA